MTRAEAEKIIAALVTLRESATDEQALTVPDLYPAWRSGVSYTAGQRVLYNEVLYKVVQAHTSQAEWVPGEGTESLYTRIDENHAGTLTDPIPYDGNMELENGKYYIQDYVIYRCTRDTVNPVYNPLAELVGLYVETV